MKSLIVSIRLKPEEHAMLSALTTRDRSTGSNPSEFFRSLLWREYNRSKTGRSHVPSSVYSELRNGRPKEKV